MNYIELPVYKNQEKILSVLKNNQALVVESPTGSGKTTQLPVILYEAGYAQKGIIGVTQPRRIAAVSVSEFIARQTNTCIPGLIGYKMRFADHTNHETKIKIMTDGILLQEMKLDPWLSKYSLLMVDEAHERSLNIDFILGLLKRVLESRSDFKVIISSATINAEIFSEYFGECPIVKIDAQRFPVTLIYDPVERIESGHSFKFKAENSRQRTENRDWKKKNNDKNENFTSNINAEEAILMKIEAITTRFINEQRTGDILIFLPGEKAIKECMKRLAFSSSIGKFLHIIPLYGRLGKEEQEKVFEEAPKGKTKVVISTNIAETSVTIDGITAVIDSGLSKLNWYNPKTFTSSLIESPVSKASANQRKGRAGRTQEGSCYRLYTRKDFENRSLFTTEEIFRTDLSEVILRMADLGITNFEDFDFIASPDKAGFISGIETLNLLEALEKDRSLSNIGKLMTEFPLAPRQSRIIVEAIMQYPDVIRETLIAAAFLSTQSPYILPPGEETDARQAHHRFRDDAGDFVSYLKLFKFYNDSANKFKFCEKNYLDERAMAEIVNVTAQLEEILSSMKIPVHYREQPLSGRDADDYLCCIGRGMIQFVCAREGRGRNTTYSSLTAEKIIIHPGSVMFRADPAFIVAGEIVRTSRMYAMSVSPLSKALLQRIHPGIFTEFNASEEQTEGKNKKERREKHKKARDFTNNIKIEGEVFEIIAVKGRKTVLLPWEKLKLLSEDAAETVYKGLKGKIIIKNQYSLLAGEKLELILSLTPVLDIENIFSRTWSYMENFNSLTDLSALLKQLDNLVRPVVWKKDARDLGFLGLFTDGEGNYQLRASRSFHTSLNESLSSLESLIDELGNEVDIEQKHIVNQCYRRLSDYLGE
ncbi:MAG: ATP-dependent RNA helicase [Treponema sp.]|nr:ATP-dependent RNA helicase [Treponema sp.]MCL2271439.1 ATP-dependent RNA helicase [Treponema sp.]